MTSWRDRASAQAQEDLDGLLQTTLPFAQEMLSTEGEFFPFGAAVDTDSQTKMLSVPTSPERRNDSASLIAVLQRILQTDRAMNRAAAIVSDVRINRSGVDAIRVDLEHCEGVALSVLVPYSFVRRRLRRTVTYADPILSTHTACIWTAPDPTTT